MKSKGTGLASRNYKSRPLSEKLPKRQCKWSNEFSQKKNSCIQFREECRELIEQERRSYRPKFVDSSTFTNFIDREEDVIPVTFHGGVHAQWNVLCYICHDSLEDQNIFCCDLCPARAHKKCIEMLSTNNSLTEIHESHEIPSVEFKNQRRCKECSDEITYAILHEQKRLKRDRIRRAEFFSSLKLQANFMGLMARRQYISTYNGILLLQARVRGIQARAGFVNELATTHRAFKIKQGQYDLSLRDAESSVTNISCTISILNNENEDLEQIYKFETHSGPPQNLSIGKWNDVFMVYSSNSLIKLSFTLHGKDIEASPTRTAVFLGQHVVDVSNSLKRAFFNGKEMCIQGQLGPMEFDPRDQHFGTTFNKSESVINASNTVSYVIHPVSNVDSKCGLLEEILSALLKGARKKWYAVLAERQLFLFSQYGDSRPKVTIHLQNGVHIEWFNPEHTIIKLSNSLENQNYLLTCQNMQHLQAWYNKITGAYKRKLINGAKVFKKSDSNLRIC